MSGMTDDQAAQLLALVKEGKSIRKLVLGPSSLFSEWHCRKYAATHPAYKETLLAASKANDIARKRIIAQKRFGSQTHCKRGHIYSGDNVYI